MLTATEACSLASVWSERTLSIGLAFVGRRSPSSTLRDNAYYMYDGSVWKPAIDRGDTHTTHSLSHT